MREVTTWDERIGNQRDWAWRGWQIRYSFMTSSLENEKKNPPLVLIHGFGAAIEHWRHNFPVLSQHHRVYALDLLGFGASRKVVTRYSVALWVQQVYDFWLTFIRKPVVLVGNSIGSLVCLQAAFDHPEMVKGIAMISLPDLSMRENMIPQWLQPVVKGMERFFSSPIFLQPLFKILRRRNVVRNWAKIAYANPHVIDDELVDILAIPPQDQGADRAFCALCGAVNSPHFSLSAKAILPQLTIPILLVWGRQDRMVPPTLAPILAGLNPRIKLVELDNAGHCPHDESPELFNPILLDWLNISLFGEQGADS